MSEQGHQSEGTGTPSVRRPEVARARVRGVLAGTSTSRRRVIAVVAAATLGFGGAAAIDQFALAAPALTPVADLGAAGDGLTRLVVTPVSGSVTDAELEALRAVPGVVHVQRVFDGSALVATHDLAPTDLAGVVAGSDVQLSPTGSVAGRTVSDPYWSAYGYNLANTGSNAYQQTAVAGADVDAPTGWRAGTGTGKVVAVTDTGMDTSHPDLQGALWTNPEEACGATTDTDGDGLVGDCHGWNFYGANADVVNAGGNVHGTGVAGIAGARADNGEGSAGVAPGVQIMPLVVGYGQNVDVTAAAAAIRYAVDHGADVINASWGSTGLAPILAAAIDYAKAAGVLVVAAAGNDSGNRDAVPFYPANYASPAVLSVGSSTAADTISTFSGYGATTVDLFAPGQKIVSPAPGGGYSAMDGTSMAAPEVAAAVALYRAHYPAASMDQLRQQLLEDTQKVAAFRGRSVTGGRLSLTALGNTAAEVQYSFTSMVARPGPVTPQVVVSGSTPAGGYSVRFGLGEEYAGELYALSGQQLTMGGATATTDDSGEAVFDLGARPSAGPLVLSPSTTLAEARYALTVQMYRDGTPVGLRFAAPLLVTTATATPTAAAPTTGAATTTAGAPTSAGSSRPGSSTSPVTARPPVSASSTAGSVPTAAGPTSGPATSTGGPSTTGASSTGARSTASSPAATTSAAGSSSSRPATTSAAATTTPARTTSPGAGGTTSSAPSSSAAGSTTRTNPAASSSTAGPTTPGPGGSRTYPGVGPFGLTSISPARVSTAGGTYVTITGTAVPSGARVRIGLTASAPVSTVSATRVVFTTPALVAGTYDVYVFAPDGTSSVLTGGLQYLDTSGTPGTSAASSTASSTSAGSSSSAAAAPSWVTGPHGERLVRSALFAALGKTIWKVGCSSSCSGIAV
jgi:subtilisin family serine protease